MNGINKNKKIRSYVLNVYKMLFAIIVIDPLVGIFISNTTLLRLMELGCLLVAIINVVRLNKLKLKLGYENTGKLLFWLLLFISIGIVGRSDFPTNLNGWGVFLVSKTGFLVYFVPFLLLFLPNREYFKDIIRLFFKLSLLVVPIWILNFSNLVQDTYKGEGIGVYLPFLSAFLLPLTSYLTKKQRLITIFLWGIYLLLMLLNARRNVVFTLVLYGCFAYMLSLIDDFKKKPMKGAVVFLMMVLGLLFLQVNMDKFTSGLFNRMANRANEDTRSGVEELFFLDFANSPEEDWIFGRGADGGYYQIVKNEETGDVSDSRKGIETGYLQLVLKGGIVYAVCIVLIIFNAILCARKSKDKTIRRYLVMVMLSYLIDLYTTVPIGFFIPRMILFWFAISVMTQNGLNEKKIAIGTENR